MLTKLTTAQSDQATNNKISKTSTVETRNRVVWRVINTSAVYSVAVYCRT